MKKSFCSPRLWAAGVRAGVAIAVAAVSLQVAFAQVPLQDQKPANMGLRPAIMGHTTAVSTGDPLVTSAAMRILMKGGNAFDAGVAALIAGGVLEQDLYSLGGEALVLVYPVKENKVTSIVGQGWSGHEETPEWFLSRNKDLMGEGLDPAVVPGALHAALTVLERWGTMSFEEVAAPAIEYAEKGFPMRTSTARAIDAQAKFFDRWPGNKAYWYKADGTKYKVGETIKLPATAKTLRRMVEAERAAVKKNGKGVKARAAGVVAARDRFYKGDIAKEMVAFLKKNEAPFDASDFSDYFARIEEPTQTTYRGYTVYKQGVNSQGPMLLETLNILEQFDLKKMGFGSADYLHTVTEAMKLAYADRDTYLADPVFVKVPIEGLLSKAYAKERAALIDPKQASTKYVAGDPLKFDSKVKEWPYKVIDVQDASGKNTPPVASSELMMLASLGRDSSGISKDTTHMAIVDKDGNFFDATPSGGWIPGAVILGDTGIAMSVRGEQFWLDKTRANQIRPHARPRYTLTPTLVFKDGKPVIALGSPGGDNQEQTILQAMLSTIDMWDSWYPNLNRAFEMPRVQTSHFYGSFWPHEAGFNKLAVEASVPDVVYDELKARGHNVSRLREFGMSGCATAVILDPASGNRFAGADPRRDCYSMAY